jgi:hypothetical protein
MKRVKLIAPIANTYDLSAFLELSENVSNKHQDQEDISPSKNCHLCPWLDTRQCLDNIYSKLPESPEITFAHHRQVSANLKFRTEKPLITNARNKENYESKTHAHSRISLKVIRPQLDIPRNTPDISQQKPCASNKYRKPRHEIQLYGWARFQNSLRSKITCTLPSILNNSTRCLTQQSTKPITANIPKEHCLNYSKSSRRI